jgi:hypothetical protein
MQLTELNLTLRPATRLSRVAALLLLALWLALLWAGLAEPLIALVGGSDPITATGQLLADQQRIADRKPALMADKSALLAAGPALDEFLPGASPSLAAAGLQSRVGALIKPIGGSIASIEPLTLADQESFHRAAVRVKLSIPAGALALLLYAIEDEKPYLFVTNLAIKAGTDSSLTVALDIFGYLAAAP